MNAHLIPCADCGVRLSRRAPSCPHCGAPGLALPHRHASPSAPRRVQRSPGTSRVARWLSTAVAGCAGAASAAIAYLGFALFAADIYLGHRAPDNVWQVLGLAVATMLPFEAAVRSWSWFRRRWPAARGAILPSLAALSACLLTVALALYVLSLGLSTTLQYMASRGDVGWTLQLAAASALLLLAPMWLWWIVCRHASWPERVAVTAALGFVAYAAARSFWLVLVGHAAGRGIAAADLGALFPAYLAVTVASFALPRWYATSVHRRLLVAEAR